VPGTAMWRAGAMGGFIRIEVEGWRLEVEG
jgi:hypothetical protein